MTEDLHHIDKLFKSEIENYGELPSPGVWDSIDKNLDKNHIIHIKRKYANLKRVTFFLALLVGGISIYDLHMSSVNKGNARNNDTKRNNRTIENKASLTLGNKKKYKTSRFKTDSRNLFCKQNETVIDKHMANFNPFTKNYSAKSINKIGLPIGMLLRDEEKINVLQTASPINALVGLHIRPTNKVLSNSTNKIVTKEDHEQKNSSQSPFSFTFFFSPDLAWYRLQNTNGVSQQGDKNEIGKKEHHDLSATAGILLEYKLNSRWSLTSGLTYSNTVISIDPKTIYAQTDNSGNIKYRYNFSSGYGFVLPSFINSPNVGDSLYAFTSTHTLQYLGIPIAAKYNITKSKLNINALLGISLNILTEGRVETLLESGTTNESEIINDIGGLKSSYFSGLAGIGVEYNLNKKIAVNFTPTARFALNSINMNVPVKSYPNSIGFAAGIKIKL